MIPNTKEVIKILKLAGFTELQSKVLVIIFRTKQIDWNYLLQILEEKEREKEDK